MWRPGEKQKGNLGGALTSLDGASGAEPLPDGVVSRDGWFLYRDDTFLVSNGTHPWMQPRPKDETEDWYFFGYGLDDYPAALQDLTTISGRIPIPPRFMLGSWASRGGDCDHAGDPWCVHWRPDPGRPHSSGSGVQRFAKWARACAKAFQSPPKVQDGRSMLGIVQAIAEFHTRQFEPRIP